MKQIELTLGQVALVDDEDYEYINQFKWYAAFCKRGKRFYALRFICKNGKRTNVSMHRVLLGLTDSKLKCDHINHNTLDNQRHNLRIATHAQNMANRSSKNGGTSKFLGVYKVKDSMKWVASIHKKGYRKYLGRFNNEEDAAKAYDNAAMQLYGEFSNLNYK